MSNSKDSDAFKQRLSPAQQARLRLVKARLQEARTTDPGSVSGAELLFMFGRVLSALEDAVDLLES